MKAKRIIGLLIVLACFALVANCEYQERLEEKLEQRKNIERHKPENNLLNYTYTPAAVRG